MKTLFIIILALFSQIAMADTIGLHVASWHSESGYNNKNPGLYYKADNGFTVGAYCNSESHSARFKTASSCELSSYVGVTKEVAVTENLSAGATAFLVHGYKRAPIIPAVAATALVANHLRVMVIPPVKGYTPMVVSFGVETKF